MSASPPTAYDEHTALTFRAIDLAWSALHGDPQRLRNLQLIAAPRSLHSIYEVSAFACACISVASLAVAEWLDGADNVRLDARHAALAFQSERWLAPIGWELPPVWDPLAGDYPTQDGFVKLHTNYAHHRAAALRALGAAPSREAIARVLAGVPSEAAEQAVIAAGGCAAALRSESDWAGHAAGSAVLSEPLIGWTQHAASVRPGQGQPTANRPLAGLRVLDLTRVIAGPVATRFLAGYGAEVLRIDPPGFQEVPLLVAEVTQGKRCTALDLRESADRARFDDLLREADVLVCGLRRDALDQLGYSLAMLHARNPALIVARLNAYGWSGPWSTRRGFDSLVQMSCGIAERGMRSAGSSQPVPLPAQALDHGTGYLLAAAIVRALCNRRRFGHASELRLSLARSAGFLRALGVNAASRGEALTEQERNPFMERADTLFGPVWRVRAAGTVGPAAPGFSTPAGPLGSAEPAWPPRND